MAKQDRNTCSKNVFFVMKVLKEEKINKEIKKKPKLVRKKRIRTRKETIKSRMFVCETCNKGYISFPALYSHNLFKHNKRLKSDETFQKEIIDKGKEEKKNTSLTIIFNFPSIEEDDLIDGKLSNAYYLKLLKHEINSVLIKNPIDFLYEDLYFPEHHSLYMNLEYLLYNNTDFLNTLAYNRQNLKCDEVFAYYLLQNISECKNATEFLKIANLLLLFTDKVNYYYKNVESIYTKVSYTKVQNTEEIPLIFPIFLTECNLKLKFSSDEASFHILKFYNWLIKNNLTFLNLNFPRNNTKILD